MFIVKYKTDKILYIGYFWVAVWFSAILFMFCFWLRSRFFDACCQSNDFIETNFLLKISMHFRSVNNKKKQQLMNLVTSALTALTKNKFVTSALKRNSRVLIFLFLFLSFILIIVTVYHL